MSTNELILGIAIISALALCFSITQKHNKSINKKEFFYIKDRNVFNITDIKRMFVSQVLPVENGFDFYNLNVILHDTSQITLKCDNEDDAIETMEHIQELLNDL